jgi:hypothetical protein
VLKRLRWQHWILIVAFTSIAAAFVLVLMIAFGQD